MRIDDSGNLERVWFLTFAVQRMGGVAASVAAWMDGAAHTPGRADTLLLARCEAVAQSFFAQRPHLQACAPPYLAALARLRGLSGRQAAFLAQPAHGDIGALLTEAGAALQQFGAALEQLAVYPAAAAEAAALRREASRCAALRPGPA